MGSGLLGNGTWANLLMMKSRWMVRLGDKAKDIYTHRQALETEVKGVWVIWDGISLISIFG